MERSTAVSVASEAIDRAPEIAIRGGPYDVVLPADGTGFVRLEIPSPTTILVFTRQPRAATRIFAPRRGPDARRPIAASDLCGAESAGANLGFGGSDEFCREDVRDHRYYDAFRPGVHFLELRSVAGVVRLWVTTADGHRFSHADEHSHSS